MQKQLANSIHPPAKIGIIGGGQLGKMITVVAKRMGYHVTVLDPNPLSPAGQVADQQITAGFSDAESIHELVACVDVSTYEFEHIDVETLILMEQEGYPIYPSGSTLKIIQDKYNQKKMLQHFGLLVPEFYKISSYLDLLACSDKLGFPFVVKYRKDGYDGKGNYIVHEPGQMKLLESSIKENQIMAERYIDFDCELSVVVARAADGQTRQYPVAENIHEHNILRLTKVPANISCDVKQKINDICDKICNGLDDHGVFCIELFLSRDGKVYVNEIAPRPHNSGHYSIEACVTSQYEQLVRILTRLPLGSVRQRSPCVMANILGDETTKGSYSFDGLDEILEIEDLHLHIYGKSNTDYLKKIGHITVLDENISAAEQKCLTALQKLKIVPDR